MLYLTGGSAYGAWQAGVVYRKIKEEKRDYDHIVGQSVGALNAVVLVGSFAAYLYETKQPLRSDAWEYAANRLREFWETVASGLGFPRPVELIIRMCFCGMLSRSLLTSAEVNGMMVRALSFLSPNGRLSAAHNRLCDIGKTIKGICVPSVSVYADVEEISEQIRDKYGDARTIAFTLGENNAPVVRALLPCGHQKQWTGPVDVKILEATASAEACGKLRSRIVLASLSIPKVFDPVQFGGDKMVLTDGGINNPLPIPFADHLQTAHTNPRKHVEIVACFEIPAFVVSLSDARKPHDFCNIQNAGMRRNTTRDSAMRAFSRLIQLRVDDQINMLFVQFMEANRLKRVNGNDIGDSQMHEYFYNAVFEHSVFLPRDYGNQWNPFDFSRRTLTEMFDIGQKSYMTNLRC